MTNEVIYYMDGAEPVSKKKYILFLAKNGFNVRKSHDVDSLRSNCHTADMVLVTDEADISAVSSVTSTVPILAILSSNRNLHTVAEEFRGVPNPLFFRFDSDPLHTVFETAKLLSGITLTPKELNNG